MEAAIQDKYLDPLFLYDAFFRFQNALYDVLDDIPSSKVLSGSSEFHHLHAIFGRWAQVTTPIWLANHYGDTSSE